MNQSSIIQTIDRLGQRIDVAVATAAADRQHKHVIYMYAVGLLGTATVCNILANSTTMSMAVKMIFAALCIPALTWTLYRMLRLRRRIRQLRRE